MQVKKRNFKESIRRLFLLYTFLPILILFIMFVVFTFINSKFILADKTKEAGRAIGMSLSEVLNHYDQEISRMASSPLVIDFAATRLNSQHVYEEFYEFNNSQQVKSVFHIIDTRGVFLASSAPDDPAIHERIYKDIIPRVEKQPMTTLTEANNVRYPYDRHTVYTFSKAIMKEGQLVGYIIYQLYEADIQKLIFVPNIEIAVITDSYNTIIATTNNITKGLMNKFSPSVDEDGYAEIKNGKYYMSLWELPFGQIQVYTLNSTQFPKYAYMSLSAFIVVTSLLLWFLIDFLAKKMSFQNTRSIDKLLYAVHQLQRGNLDSYVYIKTGDEFETLANQYNIMLKRLNELLKRNEELLDIRRLIEVKQLQSQFHPHFIFNVLETLRYAIVVDGSKAQEIVMLLSRLLRYSVNNDGQAVILNDDLNYIDDYLKLQQIRFNERLRYTVDVTPEARQALVPKLILQTMIENSIKYGYKHQEALFISVRGYLTTKDLVLEVEDNGSGMSEEQLNKIKRIMNDPNNQTKHIGLNNIHRRLVLLYGEGYGLHIDSALGKGTRVKIFVPYDRGEDHV